MDKQHICLAILWAVLVLILLAVTFLPKRREKSPSPVPKVPVLNSWDRMAALNQLLRHYYQQSIYKRKSIWTLMTSRGELRLCVSPTPIKDRFYAYVARDIGPIMNLCFGDERPRFPKLFTCPDVLIFGFHTENLYADIFLMDSNPAIRFNGLVDPRKDLKLIYGQTTVDLFNEVLSVACELYEKVDVTENETTE